ncbi:MAG: LamG domain-containing protein, partial [Candidatus Micrarchaeaceae archaeon]
VNSLPSLGKDSKRYELLRNLKSQSAMEYLMTYGWAILIIAIVMVAMFSLGIFNPLTFAPRAQPGACQVFRSVEGINLEGSCSGEIPEYASVFSGCSGCGSSTMSAVYMSVPSFPSAPSVFSMSAWIKPSASQCDNPIFGSVFNHLTPYGVNLNLEYQKVEFGIATTGPIVYSTNTLNLNTWYNIIATYSSGNVIIYINGKQDNTGSIGALTFNSMEPNFGIGYDNETASCSGTMSHFTGSLSNVQLYTAVIGPNSAASLYKGGIGGVPIDIRNLSGWWPLNGNANDYSGNNYNGQAFNTIYTSSWYDGYATP